MAQTSLNSTGVASSGSLVLQTNGTTSAVTVDNKQNVGVGVTPSAWDTGNSVKAVQLTQGAIWGYSTTNIFLGSNYYWNGTNRIYSTTAAAGEYTMGAGAHFWTVASSGTAGTAISWPSPAMTLDASGNLLVGTTSSLATGLTVSAASGVNNTACFKNTTNASGDQAVYIALGANANNTSSYYFVCAQPGTRNSLYIYGNGNVVNANNSYGTLSDVKLKENITDATPKLADIMRLQVRNFNLKSNLEHKQIGFIAQELEQVFPAMVDESPDFEEATTTDENGKEITQRIALNTTTKSIKTSVLIPMLVKAIQEQQAMIASQSVLITQLQADVASLKAK
jgi:hypothetical protein